MQYNIWLLVTYVNNRSHLYLTYEWLQNAIAKKIKRGVTPSFEQLVNSETLKRLTRAARKEVASMEQVNCSMQDDLQARKELAASIIEDAKYIAGC